MVFGAMIALFLVSEFAALVMALLVWRSPVGKTALAAVLLSLLLWSVYTNVRQPNARWSPQGSLAGDVAGAEGKTLPSLKLLGLGETQSPVGQPLLLVWLDAEQRPSRRALKLLTERADALKQADVAVLVVQSSSVTTETYASLKKAASPFHVVQGRLPWGATSLPLFILTDKNHRVVAQGFSAEELDAKLGELALADETAALRPPAQVSPVVALPDGATVQLVALSAWPRGTTAWWSPNGRPFDVAGWEEEGREKADPADFSGETESDRILQAVVAVSGDTTPPEELDCLIDGVPRGPGRFRLNAKGRDLAGWTGFNLRFPKDATTGNMVFTVAAGPFQSESMGQVTHGEEHQMLGELCGEKFTLGKLARREANAAITLSLSMVVDEHTMSPQTSIRSTGIASGLILLMDTRRSAISSKDNPPATSSPKCGNSTVSRRSR